MKDAFLGAVSADGKLKIDAASVFREHVQRLSGQRVEVVVRPHRKKRSQRANRYYWGVVIPLLAEEFGYDRQDMHEVMAMHLLRIEDCPVTGVPRRKRTPNCDSKEFAEYVDACIRIAAEHGVRIPEPGEAVEDVES